MHVGYGRDFMLKMFKFLMLFDFQTNFP